MDAQMRGINCKKTVLSGGSTTTQLSLRTVDTVCMAAPLP
jgi:hypothetical protein